MSTPLRLVSAGAKQQPISLPELMKLMSVEDLEIIERDIRAFRETEIAPPVVRDHAEFWQRIAAFHASYEKTFHDRDSKNPLPPEATLEFIRRHVQEDLAALERKSIKGTDRGFIGVLDDLTEGLVRTAAELHLDYILAEYIPNDHQARLTLAEELLRIYGTRLFPGEELVPANVLSVNIETTLKSFAMHLHAVRKQWRS